MTHSFLLSVYLDFIDPIDLYLFFCSSKMKTDFMQTVNLLTIKLQFRGIKQFIIIFLKKKRSLKKSDLFFKTPFQVFFWVYPGGPFNLPL